MFSKIILALDGSESSDRAIPVAQELALRDSAPLIVVHV
ncbi:MAG: universal stress protein, partial [Gaiellales bacterium]